MSTWMKGTYEMVARVLFETHGVVVSNKLAERFADEFARDNARFDRARFLRACGVRA